MLSWRVMCSTAEGCYLAQTNSHASTHTCASQTTMQYTGSKRRVGAEARVPVYARPCKVLSCQVTDHGMSHRNDPLVWHDALLFVESGDFAERDEARPDVVECTRMLPLVRPEEPGR